MADEGEVPTGRLRRLAKLARVGAGTGLAIVRTKASEASIDRVASILGEMRGVAAKLGQMASYIDGLVPEQHRDAFERGMAPLRNAAQRTASAQVRRTVERELGRPVDVVFAAWDDTPIASASIGQVHVATLHDGRRVAVKVQHDGIEGAMAADLQNVGLIDTTARALGMGRFEVGRLVEEARQRFGEELDYALEAERTRRFAELHRGDPGIVVPEVVSEASSARVLTTTLLEGHDFESAIAAPRELREQWVATMWRFVYGSILLGGVFNADPHPGNYRFFSDGRVGFLDFGCVQNLTATQQRYVVLAHAAANQRDFAGFEAQMARLLGARDGRQREAMAEYMELAIRPILASPFHLTRDYAHAVVTRFRALAKAMTGLKAQEFSPLPAGILFLNRLQFGFYSVLARFDVVADYAAVERTFLPQALARVG